MNTILKHQFKTAIDSKKENNFQDFINELFIKRYGDSFSPVKQKRDKGCDGILNNNTIIAAYAPQRVHLRDFKKKTSDDFTSYQQNWQSKYPKWNYVYNGEYTSEMMQYLESLKNDVITTDINALLDMIESLPHFKRRELASHLGIDEQYIINDIMKSVVEDLFKLIEGCGNVKAFHQVPPHIEDKIRLNYSAEDVDSASKEYECVLEYFTQLKEILKSYEDYEISALKSKLIKCYDKFSGNFKVRLNNITEEFAGTNKSDDSYVFFIRVVLLYFFEICIIGQRPESEKR